MVGPGIDTPPSRHSVRASEPGKSAATAAAIRDTMGADGRRAGTPLAGSGRVRAGGRFGARRVIAGGSGRAIAGGSGRVMSAG